MTKKPTHCFASEERDAENFPRRALDNDKLQFVSQIIAYLLMAACLICYSLCEFVYLF